MPPARRYRPLRPLNRARARGRSAGGRRPLAVALTYDRETMAAPVISASGQGEIAERIIALAREHNVAIRQDPELVGLLAQLDVGQIIPPELYAVVAEVLAWVYRLQKKGEGE